MTVTVERHRGGCVRQDFLHDLDVSACDSKAMQSF
jgi:hypothetical protein